jgi:hypothetical protein
MMKVVATAVLLGERRERERERDRENRYYNLYFTGYTHKIIRHMYNRY